MTPYSFSLVSLWGIFKHSRTEVTGHHKPSTLCCMIPGTDSFHVEWKAPYTSIHLFIKENIVGQLNNSAYVKHQPVWLCLFLKWSAFLNEGPVHNCGSTATCVGYVAVWLGWKKKGDGGIIIAENCCRSWILGTAPEAQTWHNTSHSEENLVYQDFKHILIDRPYLQL